MFLQYPKRCNRGCLVVLDVDDLVEQVDVVDTLGSLLGTLAFPEVGAAPGSALCDVIEEEEEDEVEDVDDC